MTGAEVPIAAATASVASAASKAVEKQSAHGRAIDRQLVEDGRGGDEYRRAVAIRAERQAVKEAIVLRVFDRIARLVGVPEDYFQTRFKRELADAMEDVPNESITAPPGNIAGPVLQNLSFAIDNETLRGLYIKLLAKASDSRRQAAIHPSFVSVISQLEPREAFLLKQTIAGRLNVPIVELRLRMDDHNMFRTMLRNLCNWLDEDGQARTEPLGSSFVDNWARLGLVEVTFLETLLDPGNYRWVDARPEFAELKAQPVEGGTYYAQRGILAITDFGRQFAEAVDLKNL